MSDDNPRDRDPQFAWWTNDLALAALDEGDYVKAEAMFEIGDQWDPPTESELMLRRKLWDRALEADLVREAAA